MELGTLLEFVQTVVNQGLGELVPFLLFLIVVIIWWQLVKLDENLLGFLLIFIDFLDMKLENTFQLNLRFDIFLVLDEVQNEIHVHLSLVVFGQDVDEGRVVVLLLQLDHSENGPYHQWNTNKKVVQTHVISWSFI